MRILYDSHQYQQQTSDRHSINESKNKNIAAIYFVRTYGCLHTSVRVCGCAGVCFFTNMCMWLVVG